MVYQPKNQKKAGGETRLGPLDRRSPRLHAAVLAVIMLLMLLAWIAGPPATQIIPLLLLVTCFHFADLGWGAGRACPIARSVRVCLPYVAKPPRPIDAAPHVRMSRRMIVPMLLLWIGMLPVPRVLLLGVMTLAAALFLLFLGQALTGKHPLLPPAEADS